MSLILSPKMASKRPSAADTVFPPKKRALYEHRKLHGIDQYSTNQIAANGMVPCQEKLGMVGLKLPINFVITEPENVSRTRSDSLNSHISSNSDNTETGSTESRETSPCTIQSMFDHQTPERNPITSLDGLKPDISKPLFPPSDSDNSMVDSEGHLSPDNSINDEQAESKADRYGRQEIIPSEESIENKSMSGKLDITIHNESQNSDVSDGLMEDMVKNNSVKQKQSEIYMGPMVSLLNRFNAEAVQNNISLKIKEHYSLEEMRNLVPSNSPFSDSAKANYAHTEVSSLPNSTQPKTLADNHDKNKVLSQIRSCHICSKDFTSVTSLQNHMKMHENKSIQCWVCKEKFQSADSLNTHMKLEHKGENPYKCEHCSREFTQFNNLRRHLRVHREKVFKCTLCNREFNEEFYLKMHMGTHTGKRIYSCGVCGSGFPSSHDLKMHVKTHSPSLLHTCDVCGKSFSKACVLRQHKKGHSGERPHKCDKCEKTFIHRHHLTMHMKSHVDEKQLSCNICQKEFSQHSHLYKHLRAHEDMKKYGLDLDSTQKSKIAVDSDPKREDNQDHQVKQRSMPKVVTPNSVPLNEPNGMNNILVERMNHSNSKTTKQKRRYVSHDFQYQNSGSVNISSLPSVGNNHLMQSVTQQFTHQIGSLSSMHYSPEMSQKYLASSPARSFSPLINPLVRNGVPSLMHEYQSYNQLYRNYSEQMQAYYSNMYMMQYMSHNALLQKEHPESPNLLNNQNNLSHKQSENKNEQNRNEVKSNLMKPKFIHGVESLENEQKMDERKDVSRDDVQSDSDGNSEVDVVNATNEQTLEKQDFDFETRDIHEKHDDINVTEHEIAQELLKMSAGTKQSETFEDNSSNIEKGKIVEDNLKLQKEVEMKKKDDSKGLNFSHCVNDIIERTVRNSKSCVNKSMSNSHYVGANNNIPVYNDAIFGDELSVVIPKSTTLSSNTNEQERNNMAHLLVLGETIDSIDSGNAGARRTSESQASPLQKLEMFVTSEKNDFNKVEATVNESGGANQNFHGNFTEDLPQVESTYGVIDSQEETEGGNSETFDEYVALLKDRNEVNVVPKQTVSVEESLEMRLKKIQQFADIGMKLGNSVNDAFERKHDDTKDFKENIEDVSYNNTVTESKNIELNADIEIDEKESVEEINYYKKEVKEDTLLNDRKVLDKNDREGSEEVSKIDIVDNISGYFDDSLEDRQLEIVENDSYREETEDVKQIDDDEKDGITVNMGHGNEGDKEQGNESEINTDHELKEIKKTLHDSEGGYIFTENEFLKHISEMNDSKKANEEDKVEMDGKNMDREDEGKIVMGENKENSMLILTSLKESLRHENNFIHKLKELESNPSEVELKAKCSGINTIENGAMDLRTERTMNKVTGDVHANNTIQNIYQENLPIDLSLSRKWSDELDKLKAGERKTDRKYVRNTENGSPSCLLLTCGLCDRKFDDVSQLQTHQIEHAKEIGYCCNVCKKLFTGAFELQCHMLKHRNSEISFQSPNRPTVNNDFKCTEVSMLGSKEQYDKKENEVLTPSKFRERNEIGENQHSCKYCDKIFVEAEQLREHIHVHNGIKKPYVCNICRRAFVHRHNLNRHKMSHNSKSYKCDVCQRTFKESFYLQMHQKTHEEENYRMCQICGENVSKSEIWQHTSQHLGNITENPTYEQIGNRVQEILHEQDVNIDEAAWKNDNTRISHNILNTSEYGGDIRKLNSDEFCTNKKALNLRKENIENLSVTINDNAAITHSNIIQNKENLWNCSPVSPKNGFEGVYRNSGSKMYQMLECHICKVVLSTKHELENHMGIHSGLRPHVCKICGRAFKKSKGLKTHEKIHLESSYNV